ncbi:CRISPR-associated endoribonuclease Cas6 [Thermoproteus tenax]|uniref:RAMP superfamily protein n=1 Tax=Thermoproteus tenax (strain ATCC 35583 / DSM 2078 / JCM 9277 / NBRC 100435 / Kra 1) TaxID=768679 RepID=G4RK11_THETK|nr:CRISPR-associated endoribonuclease Cas6 [Thermoproteus tenax]CCC81906.1 RAMP superfamily protein [Thermoproteus tenax Kra 1]
MDVEIVRISAVAQELVIIVGFTGTVVESLVIKALERPDLHDARTKPFSVWPLLHNGRPVLSAAAVAPGDLLEIRAGFADEDMARKFAESVGRSLELFGRRLSVEAVEVKSAFFQMPEAQCFKLEFLTPLRFAVPPIYRRRRALFDFLPRPLSLFKSAVRHGRQLGLTKLGTPFLKWVHTYVALTDFGCRRRCVVTVELPGGGLARGFVGWALYRSFGRRRLRDLWTVIKLMEALNVGTGRTMGLGAVRATPLDCGGRKAAEGNKAAGSA